MKPVRLTPWERSALVDRPITDQRLAQVRTEAGAFRYCLSSDVRALLARYDAQVPEADLRALRSLHDDPGAAETVPASAAEPRRSMTMSEDSKVSIPFGDKVVTGHPDAVAAFMKSMGKQEAVRQRAPWPRDERGNVQTRAAMTTLCRLFPSLVNADGIDPWDTDRFLLWTVGTGAGSGAKHAARFVLGVWNNQTDWVDLLKTEAAGSQPADHRDVLRKGLRNLRMRAARDLEQDLRAAAEDNSRDPERVKVTPEAVEERLHGYFAAAGPFNFHRAMGTWDDKHVAAALAWMEAPFYP